VDHDAAARRKPLQRVFDVPEAGLVLVERVDEHEVV
jgi:hypothetical protein